MMKSGDFHLRSRTQDSANRRLALNHSATVVCIRSDTRHRGGVAKSQASVCGIPGSSPRDQNLQISSVCVRETRRERERCACVCVLKSEKASVRVFERMCVCALVCVSEFVRACL